MKKQFAFLIAASCGIVLHAQTITQSWQPTTSTVIKTQSLDPNGADPGVSGTGKTWNFSSAVKTGTETVVTYTSPAGTTYASSFPTANLSLAQGTTLAYYKTSPGSFDLLGAGTSQYALVYSDPIQQFRFPMSYGSIYTDPYKGTYSTASYSIHRSGFITDTVDGSGTLILPGNKTITNVLRVKIFQNIIDSVFMSGTFVQLSYSYVEQYTWISPSVLGQNLLSLSEYVSGTQDVVSFTYYSGALTGIADVEETVKAKGFLYPNPAKDKVFVETTEGKVNMVSIYDLNGKEVLKTNNFMDGIDITALNKGIYFVQLVNEDGARSSQKLLIE